MAHKIKKEKDGVQAEINQKAMVDRELDYIQQKKKDKLLNKEQIRLKQFEEMERNDRKRQ